MDIFEIQGKVRRELPEKRYNHTLGVAYLAASLAMCYGEDIGAAMTAGLLHDIARCLPDEELLLRCRKYQIPITEYEEENAYLLHGKLGAYYAKRDYNVDSPEILSAIIWHTTGKPAMNFLEKIIFISDYIELGRKQPTKPELSLLRKLVFENLDLAVYYVLKNMVGYLEEAKGSLDYTTKEAMEYYKQTVKSVSALQPQT